MSTLNLTLVEARMMERRASASGLASRKLRELLDETVQVLAGGLRAAPRYEAKLGPALRRDLGLD
jgi:hypothetical protein